MGQNIYNGYYVRAGKNGEPEFVTREPGFPKTAADWPVTPKAFYYFVRTVSVTVIYHGKWYELS